MKRFVIISALLLVAGGCSKHKPGEVTPVDPITRFLQTYTNLNGSFVYSSVGIPSSATAEDALSKLSASGIRMPRITNFTVIEVRALRPQDPLLARLLTNSVAALVSTEIGQKIILLRHADKQTPDGWIYHVYDSQ